MISRFFIDRPIFAAVLSILITLSGTIAVFVLPIAQYPPIAPPTVQVSCTYPGASALVVADTVAAPIEQQVNGVEGMLYMSSQCGNDGSYNLTVTFDLSTDLNTALVMVQNRVSLATPQLPTSVQKQGLTIKKKSPNILLVINFFSTDEYDLRLMFDMKDVEGVPSVDKNRVIVADVDGVLHFRIFDAAGKMVVDTDEKRLPVQAGPIKTLREKLKKLRPPHELTGSEKAEVITAATSIAGYTPTDGRYDNIFLSNFATINIKDEIFRLEGVADISYLGQRDYSIRAWLDPQKLASRNISANEVANAIQNQNAAAAPGQVGQQPVPTGQDFQLPTDTLGRLSEPEQFGAIIVKAVPGDVAGEASHVVRLRDVARVEMGAANYNQICAVDGKPSVGLAIYQLPGTNALQVAEGIRAKMKELKKRFPDGLDYGVYYDTTPFIRESVADVVKTLLEAVGLVAIVVLVFLQNWRAALIPLIAVPVAIVGTFAVMEAIGFSLNNISLFGLVLAIGIVVDDAIVVVENVERWLNQGLSAKEAARKAMDEVTGPVVAVAVVLCAVFVPCAFISGITGQFFRQFAVTIAVSTVLSALNSLTLSPALAALLLQPHGAAKDPLTRLLDAALGWFFQLFNSGFRIASDVYGRVVGVSLWLWFLPLLVYFGLFGATGWLFSWYPVGFIPQQDQGWLLVNVQLPDSASVQRTQDVMLRLNTIAHKNEGVAHTTSIAGQSILLTSNSSNFGSMFVILKAFSDRTDPKYHADKIMLDLRAKFAEEVRDAQVNVFGAPAVPGIGIASGFKLMVEDRGGGDLNKIQTQADALIGKIRPVRGFVMVSTQFRANTPQLYMDIDRTKVKSLGISIDDINQALQIYLGSYYVNNFNAFGRYWQVNLQADGQFRNEVEAINQIQLRNKKGEMVPLSTLVHMSPVGGPVMVTRYNLYASAPVNGVIIPPLSTGQGIAKVEEIVADTLPRSMATEWTDLTYMQIKAGNTAMYVFGLAVVLVFLALAALYESWSLPLAVILVVPMCLLSSLVGVLLRHLPMDIFVQIGFVVLVGLACKNAILIVEFARQLRDEGKPPSTATTEACRLRLRPILMTSFAFILGVFPMVVAEGAGAEMRWSLGTAVFSGMLGVTLFGVFLTPVFYYVIESLGELSIFSLAAVQWTLSLCLGTSAGALLAFLGWRMAFPDEMQFFDRAHPLQEILFVDQLKHLRWALAGGLAIGLVTAVLVQGGHHRMFRKARTT